MTSALERGLLTAALLAGLASCGGGKEVRPAVVLGTSTGDLPDEWAYHRLGASDGVVDCTAELCRTQAKDLGVDLSREAGVLPVKLVINLVGDDLPVRIAPESLQPVLLLENGTALDPIDPDKVRARLQKEKRGGLEDMEVRNVLLQKAGNSRSRHAGYLYFDLPAGARPAGDRLTVQGASGEAYVVDLGRSLLQISYTAGAGSDGIARSISIGVR